MFNGSDEVQSLDNDKPKKASFAKEVLLSAAALASMGTTQASTPLEGGVTNDTESAAPSGLPRIENTIEERNFGEHFAKEQFTYTTLYRDLTNKQVMFVDERGLIIGSPVNIEPIINVGALGAQSTIVLPGNLDPRGVPRDRVSQAWLNAARLRLCSEQNVECNLGESLPRVRSTIRLVREAAPFFDAEAPAPETFFDIIRHLGNRTVPGAIDGASYISYINQNFARNSSLPLDVADDLRELLPGLAAQESQYNPAALSPVGARSILQIMPATWRTIGYSPETEGNFMLQVEAANKYFEGAYGELMENNTADFNRIRDTFFDGDQEAFDKYFLAPVLINTYNSGTGRLSRVIRWFNRNYPDRQSISAISSGQGGYGYDVYAAMAHFAARNDTPETSGYKEHSSEYFSRVFSLANIIADYNDGELIRKKTPTENIATDVLAAGGNPQI